MAGVGRYGADKQVGGRPLDIADGQVARAAHYRGAQPVHAVDYAASGPVHEDRFERPAALGEHLRMVMAQAPQTR
ncbi:hypothetical protein OG730_08225 [Streptomyces sp. NBC_01298]|uniref:hypothetical protein n=1 Tax=Streptomyces sp. NBC_01298 TaxID=2903817 RepID=UPI002E13F7C2|nr:hypothetical protein OG730_08225 [Streptomyces sp. NBC_01298]